MKPHPHPNPRAIFITTVVLAVLIRLPAISSQQPSPYDACRQSLPCGSEEFEYPFWGERRPAYCGHPGFQLTCSSDVPLLKYQSVEYRVLDKDSSTQTIKVARNDLQSTLCPPSLHNTTYNHTLFNGNNFDQYNVSLYYGCQTTIPVPVGPNYRFTCDGTDSYFYRTDRILTDLANSLVECRDSITVPVNRSSADRIQGITGSASESDLRSALIAGFNLLWTIYDNECDQCVRSSGECGSNSTSPESFACYCASGTFSLTCNNEDQSGGLSKLAHTMFVDGSVQCGNIALEYPFWGEDRPDYCGHPGFQLTCQSNVSLLSYQSVEFRVLETETSTQTIKVARNDLQSTICPQYLHNTTYNFTLFNGNNFGQQNVSLYYGCDSTLAPPLAAIYRFRCDVNSSQTDSYFYKTDSIFPALANSLVRCNDSITVPVDRSWGDRIGSGAGTESNLRSALTDGFNLQWTAYNDECDQCIRSKGECGSNSTSPDLFACYCATGNFSLTCNNEDQSGGGSKSSSSLGIVIGIVGAVIACVLIVGAIFVWRQRRKRRAIKEPSPAQTETKAILTTDSSKVLTSDNDNFTSSIPSYPSGKTSESSSKEYMKSTYFGAQVFTYEELEVATDNFNDSRELGDGGFGTVYYGKLLDGREVAVKRLYENNFKRVEQFINEVRILTGLDHENLVKLYGCTSKRSKELLLVYEYIPNGTIADHLHGKLANASSSLFSWTVRLNIAIETADALAYLHKSGIIHRDVKTNNILLDKSFRVKVADFGLSRLFQNVTHVSTAPQGTPGYVDPEYYQCYHLTDKSDVYSFGVVLIELISSLQAVDTTRHRLDINLANMAMTKIQNHQFDELVDKSIGFETNGSVRRMTTLVAELAFRCLQQEKDMRPTMKEVVDTLRGIQSDDLNAQKPEVLDIVVDDGGLLKGHNTEPTSPESGVTNKLVGSSVPSSFDS